MTASGEVLDQWVNRRRVPHRAFAQTPEQRLLVVPRGEIERGVERPSKSDEGISRAIDRLGRAGFETGLQIRGFRYGRRPRAQAESVCKASLPRPPAAPCTRTDFAGADWRVSPAACVASHIVTKLYGRAASSWRSRSRGAFRAVAAFTTTCELWDPFRDTGFTP